jgi:hypothetical protein
MVQQKLLEQSFSPTHQRVSNDASEEDDDVEADEDHLKRVHAHPTPASASKAETVYFLFTRNSKIWSFDTNKICRATKI